MGTDRRVPKKRPKVAKQPLPRAGNKGLLCRHCWSGCVRLWGTRNFSRVWEQAGGTGYRAPGAEAYRVPRAQRDPRSPSLPPGAGYATAHLLDGRQVVPVLGRARGEARGRGRLVVLKGLSHEFRHGDRVRHRQGAGARTVAASVAQDTGSDPAAAAAPGFGQRGARARKSPQGAGATAGRPVAAGARAVRSSARCAPGDADAAFSAGAHSQGKLSATKPLAGRPPAERGGTGAGAGGLGRAVSSREGRGGAKVWPPIGALAATALPGSLGRRKKGDVRSGPVSACGTPPCVCLREVLGFEGAPSPGLRCQAPTQHPP